MKNTNQNKKSGLDKKGGDPNGLLFTELAKLPIWKLNVVIFLLKLHLNFVVKFYLKH